MDNTVTTDKVTLQSVLTCLQVSCAKVEHQTQTQLLHGELQRKNQHSELVFVHKNPLFNYDDDDDDPDQQPMQGHLSELTSDICADEDEVMHEQKLEIFGDSLLVVN